MDTPWDKIRIKLFHLFHNDIIDLGQDKFTQGFADGYVMGRKHYKEQEDQRKKLEAELFPVEQTIGTPTPIVDIGKVLTESNGRLYLNNVPLDAKQISELKQEAHLLRNTKIWEIITNTLDSQAFERGWHQSKTLDDLQVGRTISATVEIQKQIIKKIENAK